MLPFLLFADLLVAQEICDNGVDDDGNGLVDLNDVAGCPCDLVVTQPSLITNGSFEDNTCCPQGLHEYFECATGWMNYFESATVDYYNCNYVPSAIPQPLPDGSGVVGFGAFTDWSWNNSYYEYLTTCLNSPMQTGETFELQFNIAAARLQFMQPSGVLIPSSPLNMGPIDLAIYGYASCITEPYVYYDPVFGNPLPATYCATDLGWTELGHVTYNPVTTWQEISFTFTAPFDVQGIMFGPTCPVPQDYISTQSTWPYFFLDAMDLTEVTLVVNRTGHPCTNDLVLTGAPYSAMNTYQWFLDGVAIVGQMDDTLHASTLGLGEGTYALRMIAPDGTCLVAEEEVLVEYPVPLASMVPQEGCAPLNVEFTNLTTPALSAMLNWDFGDGASSAAPYIQHIYNDPGVYDVTLTVTSALGCSADSIFEDAITVHPRPVASFETSATEACVGEEITFTNTSAPTDAYTCSWSFGDGTLSTDCITSYAYASAGTYNVLLAVTSVFGCTDDTLRSQLITILPTPEPAFSFTTDNGCIPLEVRFENETPDQEVQTALWDLGNGQSANTPNAIALYDTPGVYTVALTMTNALGCSATHTVPNAITAHGLPVVTFFVEPDSGCAPLDVQFTNTTDPGMIGGCVWMFGDGMSSTSCGTEHTYEDSGTYTVSLTVNSPAGCEGDTTLYHLVHVDPSPTANFTFGPQPTNFYQPEVTFVDASSNDVILWSWHFPEGSPDTASSGQVTVSYPNDDGGSYPAQLVVSNRFGCTDTLLAVVAIDGVHSVYAPNAFTPDGDGVNAVFLPMIRDDVPSDHDMRIFDRWGREVFRTTDPGQGWDGSVDGAGPKTDVYVWKLRSRNRVDGIMREYIGHVTVLR
ncbi:MAG: PKD domain-containing protein [Flavobacteriales bacterium]|nr:PKD domain-containing protein [Flavobacteriales bacterium]